MKRTKGSEREGGRKRGCAGRSEATNRREERLLSLPEAFFKELNDSVLVRKGSLYPTKSRNAKTEN